MDGELFTRLGVALLLGLLVGVQRERTESSVAGIRTFALIALFGAVCALLGLRYGAWVPAAGLGSLAALFVVGNLARMKAGDIDPGLTTEMAGLLLFGVGAYVMIGSLAVGVAVGGALAVLLQWKKPLHDFVAAVGEADIKAIMQFVLVTLVILPVLPNRVYGPYAVLNPFKIWLLVVLIVAISLIAYISYKFAGPRAGLLVGGLLGGLISSTATTVTYARHSRGRGAAPAAAALVVMLASAVVFGRVLVLIAVVAAPSFSQLAGPVLTMLVVCGLLAGLVWWRGRGQPAELALHGNPAQLGWALLFGALYAAVLVLVAAGKHHFGDAGLYTVAALSGLTDMDAITLSTAQYVDAGRLTATDGWRAILVAAVANLVFKTGIVALLGNRRMLAWVAALFGAAVVAGALILAFWPAGMA